MATIRICGVYKITNIINGKCYIGQSIDIHKRWAEHKRKNNDENTYLRKAIKKYGIYFFKFEIVVVCSRDLLDWHEKLAIAGNAALAPAGYNLSSGGRSTTWAYKPSEETLKKRSIALTGKKRTEETKKKMSDAQKRRFASKDIKQRRRGSIKKSMTGGAPSNKGIPLPDITKAKIRAAKTGKAATWRRRVLVRSDGEIFSSITLAAEAINANRATIHKQLNGTLKTVHGFTFQYGGVPLQQ